MENKPDQDSFTTEIMDRAERRHLKDEARKEADALKAQNKAGLDTEILKKRTKEYQKFKKKKNARIIMAIGSGVVILLIVISMLSKPKIGLTFDICETFLEGTLRFPKEMRMSTVEDYGSFIRLWYTQVDAFGAYRMENIQCYFKDDEKDGFRFDKVTINRRDVDPRMVSRFNKAVVPLIVAQPLDLPFPQGMPNRLEDLKVDTDSVRKKLF